MTIGEVMARGGMGDTKGPGQAPERYCVDAISFQNFRRLLQEGLAKVSVVIWILGSNYHLDGV